MRDLHEVYDTFMDNVSPFARNLSDRGLSQDATDPIVAELAMLSGISFKRLEPIVLVVLQVGVDWEREVANEARAMLGDMKL